MPKPERAGDQDDGRIIGPPLRASAAEVIVFAADGPGAFHVFLLMRYRAVGWEAASMPTSNEYHEGVEACYRLAGEVTTETDRLA